MASKKRPSQRPTSVNISFPDGISSEEMKHIIAEALLEAEDIRKERTAEKSKKTTQKIRSAMGCKDYIGGKWYTRWLYFFRDILTIFIKLPVIPKEKIEGDLAATAILKAIIISVFQFIMLGFGAATVGSIWGAWHQKNIIYLFLAFPCYILMGIFRMVSIEIDKIEDRNYLLCLFAAITSTISIVFSVMAYIKGR